MNIFDWLHEETERWRLLKLFFPPGWLYVEIVDGIARVKVRMP